EKISYLEKTSNEEVLKRVEEERKLLKCIMQRKTRFAGHVLRGSSGHLAQMILQGKVVGGRRPGGPMREWFDDIKDWTGLGMKEATDREK
ncbi:hypothetical protein HET73_04605, partial [Wolbachia endosymbiont of Atemnus politus]|uniref:hypothetical protein n=1 Tax=Wolbachia endosymbiont of Atemnus politus TaxID=2682840 RepID=UPI0015744450